MVKLVKLVDRIAEALGLFYEEEEDVREPEEEEQPEAPQQAAPRAFAPSAFARKNAPKKQEPVREITAPERETKKTSLFSRKTEAGAEALSSRTIALPLADKQVRVVVLEPGTFDDSQKIADYLRNSQPVVVNFESTDNVVTKRMTDFISGTVYALGGSMKKIGRSILVCAPKNVDIDAGNNIYDEKGGQPWEK